MKEGGGGVRVGRDTNSKHWLPTSFLQSLRYLVYAIGSRKLSADEFFVDAQTVGSQFVTNYSDIGGEVLLNVLRCQLTY